METARKATQKHKKEFKERLAMIQLKRTELLKEREQIKQATEQRLLLQKEKIPSDMIHYGLWQSVEDVDKHLQEATSESQQKNRPGIATFRK